MERPKVKTVIHHSKEENCVFILQKTPISNGKGGWKWIEDRVFIEKKHIKKLEKEITNLII